MPSFRFMSYQRADKVSSVGEVRRIGATKRLDALEDALVEGLGFTV